MTLEELWGRKSDEELLVASTRLAEYTESGQRIILGEMRRRNLAAVTADSMIRDELRETTFDAPLARVDQTWQSYVARLWRGEVSLATTYWMWGVLFGGLIRVVSFVLLIVTSANVAVAIGLIVLYLTYCVFIYVAIWRSSSLYGGPRIWRDLARL